MEDGQVTVDGTVIVVVGIDARHCGRPARPDGPRNRSSWRSGRCGLDSRVFLRLVILFGQQAFGTKTRHDFSGHRAHFGRSTVGVVLTRRRRDGRRLIVARGHRQASIITQSTVAAPIYAIWMSDVA